MKLAKHLGIVEIYAMAAGAMISSGLFILPGLAHAKAGPAVIFSYLLAGLLAMTGLFSIAELTTAMPKAGGDYFYISRGMGPAVGTAAGLLSWFSLSLKAAFALVGLAVLVKVYLPVNFYVTAILCCGVFVGINLVGVREAARFQVVLVAGLLVLMGIFIVRGFASVDVTYYEPFAPYGIKPVLSTAGFVFVSYGGLLQIASVAGEVKEPGKVIPKAMLIALVSVVVMYVLTVFVASGVLGAEQLDSSLTPISDAAAVFMGKTGVVIVGIAAMLAFVTTANAGILAASRYLFAVSNDGFMPESLGKVWPRFQTPFVAILVTGAVISASMFLELDVLVEAGSIVFILGYMLASVTVIILRESNVQNYRPSFKVPLYPWLQIASIVAFGFVMFEMGEGGFLIAAVMVVAGFAVYWIYGRKEAKREYALLHLVERITAKDSELVTGRLENELKEIIRERDAIELDRFDRIVEKCEAVDIEGPVALEKVLKAAAEKMAGRLGTGVENVYASLMRRESEYSTVLSDRLAVPHAFVEGEGKFDIVLIRCGKGAMFSDKAQNVKIVIVLAGSKDERNLYLRALSAVVQVVGNPGFEKKWMSAKNEQGLRDAVLLARRRRWAGQ